MGTINIAYSESSLNAPQVDYSYCQQLINGARMPNKPCPEQVAGVSIYCKYDEEFLRNNRSGHSSFPIELGADGTI